MPIQNKSYFANAPSVTTNRILYTPSTFARTNLYHIQEVGSLRATKAHISQRENLMSFLCFVPTAGSGEMIYDGITYHIVKGDCVFIDCRKQYAHRTDSKDLWELSWCHFYGPNLLAIYDKYVERGGLPCFSPENSDTYVGIIKELYELAASEDYIRDMRINEKLGSILTLLIEESWHPENTVNTKKRMELQVIKEYIENHYNEKITLDELSKQFFINKYYLTQIFKEQYGMPINAYILQKRVTEAKRLLRFTDMSIEEVGSVCGISDQNYFSRLFKKIEGICPSGYRRTWMTTGCI